MNSSSVCTGNCSACDGHSLPTAATADIVAPPRSPICGQVVFLFRRVRPRHGTLSFVIVKRHIYSFVRATRGKWTAPKLVGDVRQVAARAAARERTLQYKHTARSKYPSVLSTLDQFHYGVSLIEIHTNRGAHLSRKSLDVTSDQYLLPGTFWMWTSILYFVDITRVGVMHIL